jgi:hypothetical protein
MHRADALVEGTLKECGKNRQSRAILVDVLLRCTVTSLS